jgi:hypothetical protein
VITNALLAVLITLLLLGWFVRYFGFYEVHFEFAGVGVDGVACCVGDAAVGRVMV